MAWHGLLARYLSRAMLSSFSYAALPALYAASSQSGIRAMHSAADGGLVEIVEALAVHGAGVNAIDVVGLP